MALVELGDPAALAASYVDRPLQLIGPRYYLTWWRLLKLLYSVVLPIAVAAVVLAQLLSGADVGERHRQRHRRGPLPRRAPRVLDHPRVRRARALAGQGRRRPRMDARHAPAAARAQSARPARRAHRLARVPRHLRPRDRLAAVRAPVGRRARDDPAARSRPVELLDPVLPRAHRARDAVRDRDLRLGLELVARRREPRAERRVRRAGALAVHHRAAHQPRGARGHGLAVGRRGRRGRAHHRRGRDRRRRVGRHRRRHQDGARRRGRGGAMPALGRI